MDLPTVVGQQTLYYIEVSLSFTYFLSLPLLKSYRKLLVGARPPGWFEPRVLQDL